MLAVILFCFTFGWLVRWLVVVIGWALVPPFPDLAINALPAQGYGTVEWLGNIVNACESRRIIWSVVQLGG